MAFLAALPEIAEAGEAAGGAAEAGGAAGGGGGGGGGLMSKVGDLFSKPAGGNKNTEQPNRQNVGGSRMGNFMDAANQVRTALRGNVD